MHGSDSILTNAQYLAADCITACGNGIPLTQDVAIHCIRCQMHTVNMRHLKVSIDTFFVLIYYYEVKMLFAQYNDDRIMKNTCLDLGTKYLVMFRHKKRLGKVPKLLG